MKISISLEAEIDFDIKVNNSILDEVARRYNGEAENMSFIFSDVMEKKIKEIIGDNNV